MSGQNYRALHRRTTQVGNKFGPARQSHCAQRRLVTTHPGQIWRGDGVPGFPQHRAHCIKAPPAMQRSMDQNESRHCRLTEPAHADGTVFHNHRQDFFLEPDFACRRDPFGRMDQRKIAAKQHLFA